MTDVPVNMYPDDSRHGWRGAGRALPLNTNCYSGFDGGSRD